MCSNRACFIIIKDSSTNLNQENWKNLMASYPKEYILIVSNSAGTDDDTGHEEAQLLQKNTGITVLRHSTKKPGCLDEIRDYFSKFGIQSNEIAIIGDRMFTDVLMANMMGAWGIWLSEGVETSQKIFPRIERAFYDKLVTQRPDDPFVAPVPKQS
ncbi:uncharacterized protein PRCAT00001883001 [Priceomyces carsonii]|uniref:uncharacterized protein n=1 Tax=Priceomyces carsonii TaxID=28549 RepID=UPI002ED8962F|nr:unnamed protein product [Priceomyces carsonii]